MYTVNDDTPVGKAGKIRTFTGKLVDPFDLQPADIRMEDIARSLSQTCRFTGHTRSFYSVGEHCLLVARFMPPSNRLKLAALLHDASEAYFGDMAGPTKCRPEMAAYRKAEHDAGLRIWHKFGLDLDPHEQAIIKEGDIAAYEMERGLFIRTGDHAGYTDNFKSAMGTYSPREVEIAYLRFALQCMLAN